MTRALIIASLLLTLPLVGAAGAAKQKGAKKGRDVVSTKTLRLPGVSPGLRAPSEGKAAKVSKGLADGIARGLQEGESFRPIAFRPESAGFKPHNGAHFPMFEINIDGTRYQAYVRSTPTAAWLTAPLKSVEDGQQVILHNPKTKEWSAAFGIKRWQSGNFLAGF